MAICPFHHWRYSQAFFQFRTYGHQIFIINLKSYSKRNLTLNNLRLAHSRNLFSANAEAPNFMKFKTRPNLYIALRFD